MRPSSRFLPALLILVGVPFLPVLDADFVNWDDDHNLIFNESWRGLGCEHLSWMFTTGHHGGYYPLAWVSFAVDHALWGMDARGYHLTNLLLHVLSSCLLYLLVLDILRRVRGREDGTVRCAALLSVLVFAVHPLRTESVAWITERRGLLAAVLWIASTLAYVKARSPERSSNSRMRWAVGSVALFLLSLLSKVIGITLPVVLILLDLVVLDRRGVVRLVIEKWPWIVAAFVVGVVARSAQVEAEAVRSWTEHGLGDRCLQSAFGVCFYLWTTVFPLQLSPIYPLENAVDPSEPRFFLTFPAVIVGGVFLALKRRRWPAIAAAFLAYVLILLPILGISQSGPQIAADRYTYLATLPLVALGAGALDRSLRGGKATLVAALVAICILLLGAGTWRLATVWQNSISLWEHGIARAPESATAHLQYAQALADANRHEDAARHYQRCTQLKPTYSPGWYNLGLQLYRAGRHEEAARAWSRRLRLPPKDPRVLYCMAIASEGLGQHDDTLVWCTRTVQAAPGYAPAWLLMARVRRRRGQLGEARRLAKRAIHADPAFSDAHEFLSDLDR